MVLGVLALGGAILQALGDSSGKPAPAATSAAQQPKNTELAVPDVPDLTGTKRAAYLAALGVIDQGLVVNEDRVVRRGQSTCTDILEGKPNSMIVHNAQVRFTGGDATVSVHGPGPANRVAGQGVVPVGAG
ncbi:hypothetical protein GCM10009530_35850 [Microbispora corallina]|uniref:DUF3060 domain-containing protein n=1 Tax=Microbispora corallina TaxID=83302 RepID=A0ABQ4FYJ4_9ACTN|nr:hypothetical protein [Microbispora corallina]GIH39879.1 hypothetical protein Mco01_28790 [Microbispora corallina]